MLIYAKMWNGKSLPDLTIVEMKDILKKLQLLTAGNKAELMARVLEADPDGTRLQSMQEGTNKAPGMSNVAGGHVDES